MADTGSAIQGISGSCSITGHIARLRAWSMNITQDVNDASGFSSQPNRTNVSGMIGWRGSASGYLIASAASTAPAVGSTGLNGDTASGVAITLTAKTGNAYTGNAIVSNVVLGTGIDGNATVAFDFVGNGALTETWATT